MSRPLRLRKEHLLPDETVKIAKVIKDNQPIERDRFEVLIHEHDSLDMDDVPSSIRMLTMTDNLEIEDSKASIKSRWCGEDTRIRVMEKFKRWKREAQNS